MERQEGGSYQIPHCDKIKRGGKIAVSGFLGKKELIAVERIKTDGEARRWILSQKMSL